MCKKNTTRSLHPLGFYEVLCLLLMSFVITEIGVGEQKFQNHLPTNVSIPSKIYQARFKSESSFQTNRFKRFKMDRASIFHTGFFLGKPLSERV